MCNLYANRSAQAEMRRLFGVAPGRDRLGNFAPLGAVWPRHSAPVVRPGADGAREMVAMHWGFLMPQVSRATGQPILPKAVNNARDDKIAHSPFWRASFESRRCLVPATAFAEAKGKNPATWYWFGMAADDAQARPPFALAGLWRGFEGVYRGEMVTIDTYTVVTTAPNALVRPVHPDRMPVILPPEAHEAWLSATPREAADLVRPFPPEAMRVVARGVGLKADTQP